MNQRNKSPNLDNNGAINSRVAFNKNQQGLQLARPQYNYYPVAGSLSQLKIIGYETGCGDNPIVLPYRVLNVDDQFDQVHQLTPLTAEGDPATWTIDMTTTVINLDTYFGGIIDGSGVSYSNSLDWNLWGFIDPSAVEIEKFKGFGVTMRPASYQYFNYAAVGSATLGTVGAVFTNGGGSSSYIYPIGCRVLLAASASATDKFNQGIVTAHDATTITVDLDSSYGFTNNNNTDLTGQTVYIIQMDKFQPRMYNEDSLYPGSGTEYQYIYMGMIQTNVQSGIKMLRKPGDIYRYDNFSPQVFYTNTTTNGEDVICLSQWLPRNTKTCLGRTKMLASGSEVTVEIDWITGLPFTYGDNNRNIPNTGTYPASGLDTNYSNGLSPVKFDNSFVAFKQYFVGSGTVQCSWYLDGFVWEEW